VTVKLDLPPNVEKAYLAEARAKGVPLGELNARSPHRGPATSPRHGDGLRARVGPCSTALSVHGSDFHVPHIPLRWGSLCCFPPILEDQIDTSLLDGAEVPGVAGHKGHLKANGDCGDKAAGKFEDGALLSERRNGAKDFCSVTQPCSQHSSAPFRG